MQQPLAEARAVKARAGGDEVDLVEHRGELAHEARLRAGVGVEEDDDVPRARLQPLFERPRLAAPAGRQRRAGEDARAAGSRDVGGCIRRAVVYDDELVHVGVLAQAGEARAEPLLLVACGDDDADRGRGGRRAAGLQRCAALAPARQAGEHDGGRGALGQAERGGAHPLYRPGSPTGQSAKGARRWT